VIGTNEILLVDFWASWCGPYRRFAPVFEAASDLHPDIVFGKVDTEAERELSAAARITSIPTLMVFRDGIAVSSQPGVLPAVALNEVLTQAGALNMESVREGEDRAASRLAAARRFRHVASADVAMAAAASKSTQADCDAERPARLTFGYPRGYCNGEGERDLHEYSYDSRFTRNGPRMAAPGSAHRPLQSRSRTDPLRARRPPRRARRPHR
jgi:thioredoxin 1